HGRRPVFSPDGRSIAYWVGENLVGGRIFVVAAHGGEPLAVQSGFHGAICPLWTPDGKGLLFAGIDRPRGRIDWWFTPVQGGTAAATGAVELMRGHGMEVNPLVLTSTATNLFIPSEWKSDGSAVVFSGITGSTSNLWEISLSPGNRQATAIRRLSSGTSFEVQPATAGSAVAFASCAYKLAIWSLPFRPDEIRAAGEMQPLTQGAPQEGIPSVSADGKRLVFVSNRAGVRQIWMRDLNLGKETTLTATPGYPRISPDGSTVAYRALAGDGNALYTVPATGGLPEKQCENCGGPADFSPDGAGLLLHFTDSTNSKTAVLDLRTGARAAAIEHSQSIVAQPHFSPDGRWIAFHSHVGPGLVRLFVAPFPRASPPQPKDWIPVTEGNTIDRDACWSPDGSVLYFHSERDGFRCLWAQRLHPVTKRPVAAPASVLHLHSRRRGMRNVPIGLLAISVARDKIVFPVSEVTGDIWRMEWGETASSPAGR
ncbi:MAG: PD40 domain-containing protein, partial [Bryobacterales bacterium]|nr:PD40 domain-containing protein [Bryobacterales bacterium]